MIDRPFNIDGDVDKLVCCVRLEENGPGADWRMELRIKNRPNKIIGETWSVMAKEYKSVAEEEREDLSARELGVTGFGFNNNHQHSPGIVIMVFYL